MRILKRSLPLIICVALVSANSSRAAEVPESFTFLGHGYGHGVGMSQFGARGQAFAGANAIDILKYYYKNISVEDTRDDQNLRVNIGHLLSIFSISTNTKFAKMQLFVGDIQDTATALPVKTISAKASLNFTLLGNSAIPSVTNASGSVQPLSSGKVWTIRWSGTRYLNGPSSIVTFKNGSSKVQYRYGQIQVKLVNVSLLGYRMEVTNTVRLHDEYLWGIGEMPSSWPMAALQAQAIASRSYALNKLGKKKSSCDCDIFGSSQDQSFVGYVKESEPKYGKIWKEAVTSTSVGTSLGLVALYKSLPISAFFFSSSGGQTESAKNAWGSDIPYTQSVADPWSLDPSTNPRFFTWERKISQATAATAFGLPDVVSVVVTATFPSGMVSTLLGVSSSGASSLVTGTVFSTRTKLPSAWFAVSGVTMSDASPSPTPTETASVSASPSPSDSVTLSPDASASPSVS